jgi:4-aminobutyrate aminotransferase-like enzyme
VPTDRFSGRAACTTASSGVSPATSNEPPSSSNPFANVQARRPVTEQHTGPVQSLGEWGQGGDEAVENTIKIARYHTRRPGIVCFENAFHGRTFLTMAPTSKSLTGGLPLGAVTGTAEVMDAVHVGGLGGTFGGNPLACRAALAVLQIIEKEGVVGRATELGRDVREALEEFQRHYAIIGEVRGLGATLALELVKDRTTKTQARTKPSDSPPSVANGGWSSWSAARWETTSGC